MPGAKPPITHFKDPADQALAKRLGFPAAAPAAAPAAPSSAQAERDDAAAVDANAARQNAAQQATIASGQPDDATGVDAAVAAQQANQGATPAAPAAPAAANRDSMTFSQAFADARKAGEKEFTWKGKKYTTQVTKTTPGLDASGRKTAATDPRVTGNGQGATPTQTPVNTAPKPGEFATTAGGAATGNPNIAKQGKKAGAIS